MIPDWLLVYRVALESGSLSNTVLDKFVLKTNDPSKHLVIYDRNDLEYSNKIKNIIDAIWS